MQNPIDRFLNSITMYRLVVYGLLLQLAVAGVAALFGQFSFSAFELVLSMAILMAACQLAGALLSRAFGQISGNDSAAITAFILACIITPQSEPLKMAAVACVGFLAMLSKYVIAYRGRQILNPVAAGVVAASVLQLIGSSWWIANPFVVPVTAIVGFLIVRKLHRLRMIAAFVSVSLIGLLWLGLSEGRPLMEVFLEALLSYPIVFLGSLMLTEPVTTPSDSTDQVIYGGLVGGLFASRFDLGIISGSPALALLIGNAYSFAVSPKQKPRLRLKERTAISPTTYDLVFETDRPLQFQAGQYVELSMPGFHWDARGNRRFFTIASSPGEAELRFGIKIPEHASSFKQRLLDLPLGGMIGAGSVQGSFKLPDNPQEKLLMFAGGIGITPFRSHLRHLLDSGERRDIVLFHAISDASEAVYGDVLSEAEAMGVKVIRVLSGPKEIPAAWAGESGLITLEMLKKYAPDCSERTAYLSGPNRFVDAYRDLIVEQGVPIQRIKTDYFPGY